MPYFKNNEVNILLIHIPKTGGTSVEKYFSNKYNIELNNDFLYLFLTKNNIPIDFNKSISLQHQTYKDIFKFKDFLNVDFNNLKIITIVRNPYERIISDLFFYKYIEVDSTKEYVYSIIIQYLNNNNIDNHNIPQYLFILDENDNLLKNITIFKTEDLTNQMQQNGYPDFNIVFNSTNRNKLNYYDYLNKDSIKLINSYYEKDFTYFDYEIL